jgi:hypothetical protein
VEQRSSEGPGYVSAGAFEDHSKTLDEPFTIAIFMLPQRSPQHAVPSHVARGPIDLVESHSNQINMPAIGGKLEHRDNYFATRVNDAFGQSPGALVLEQLPNAIGQSKKGGSDRVNDSTVPFKQLHHVRIVARECLVHRARGGIDIRVRVRTVVEEDLGHDDVPADRALAQWIAPRIHHVVEAANALALIGIMPRVQKRPQDLGPIRAHGARDRPFWFIVLRRRFSQFGCDRRTRRRPAASSLGLSNDLDNFCVASLGRQREWARRVTERINALSRIGALPHQEADDFWLSLQHRMMQNLMLVVWRDIEVY